MPRTVVITGLGPVSGCGIGIDANWDAIAAGCSAIGRINAFDPSGFDCRIAAEVKGLNLRDVVPKAYRKAIKLMARDIALAVAAADCAARDARLTTQGTHPDASASYPSDRIACHVGSGMITPDTEEFVAALVESRDTTGDFDLRRWGGGGMNHLTPLWLLKYLANMLACHVSIIHGCHGPSNTIACAEAGSGLSVGQSLRVIQRGGADVGFCGGAESKLNLTAYASQSMRGRFVVGDDPPSVRPFDERASGMALGEGGGLVILEAFDTARARPGLRIYAEVKGFGATQTVHRIPSGTGVPPVVRPKAESGLDLTPRANDGRDARPTANLGDSLAAAIRIALREAEVGADAIDLIVPTGTGVPAEDRAEVAAMRAVFGDRLGELPVLGIKSQVGNCGAGAGALDLAVAAKALHEQTIPAILNRKQPLSGLSSGSSKPRRATLRYALVFSAGTGGQNCAIVLGKTK